MNGLYPLTDEYELISRFQSGESRALEKLMRCSSYEKMLRSAAAKAARRNSALDADDLYSAGALAFVEAARVFDTERANGARLGTYARGFILDKLSSAARESATISLGKGRSSKDIFSRVTRECKARGWSRTALSDSQLTELSSVFNCSKKLLKAALERINAAPNADIHELELADDSQSAEDVLEAKQRSALLAESISKLTPRQQHIMRRRYKTDEPATLDTLAAELGLSREAVRKSELSSIRTLAALMTTPRTEKPTEHPARGHITEAPAVPLARVIPLQLDLFHCESPTNLKPASSRKSFSGSRRKEFSRGTTRPARRSRSTAAAGSLSDFRARQTCLLSILENSSA